VGALPCNPLNGGWCAGHAAQRKGWYKRGNGYIYVWEPEHPNADKRGYVAEHTKVMASIMGRPLLPEEEVHHRNGKRNDNRAENLELWARGRQPPGARVSDLIEEAVRILLLYAPDRLSKPS
jgi:HNH endonuclease